jgi:hypothetical protein
MRCVVVPQHNRVLSQAKKKFLTLKIFCKIPGILQKKRSRRCALSRAKRTFATPLEVKIFDKNSSLLFPERCVVKKRPFVSFSFERRVFCVVVKALKLPHDAMGGQRIGSMKELRLLERRRRFHRFVNYIEYRRQKRRRDPHAFSSYLLRELVLKKHYKRRLQYLESRISQSSCVPKRDFTAYFDDAERFNEQKCLALFRFKMEDINTMVELLGLNDMTFRLSNRTKYTGKEGFLVLLTHLTRASEFVGLIEEGFTYGSVPAGSQLANEVCRWLYETWAGPLLEMPLRMWLTSVTRAGETRVEYYRRCMAQKMRIVREEKREEGARNFTEQEEYELEELFEEVRNTTFLVDGTTIKICRPEILQEHFYNGRTKDHQLSYTALITPDGMAARLGGYEGKTHDAKAYRRMGLEFEMEDLCTNFDGDDQDDIAAFTVYADAAYGKTRYMNRVHKRGCGGALSEVKKHFNLVMSACRISVEQHFALKENFSWLRKSRGIRVRQSIKRRSDEMFAHDMKIYCCFFLNNLRNCMRESSISSYNNCVPPTIEEYLAMRDRYLNEEDEEEE